MRLLWLLLLAAAAFAQPVTIGVRAGARLNSEIESGGNSESKAYLAGPMVELRLPHRFALEADALYSRFGYSSTARFSVVRDPFTHQPLNNVVTERARANSWEFPLVLKYRLAAPFYVLAGYAPRHIGGTYEVSGYAETSSAGQAVPISGSGTASYSTNHAFVLGAGVAWRAGPVRVEPEVRYLRSKNALGTLSGDAAFHVLGSRNEVQILVGIGWGGR